VSSTKLIDRLRKYLGAAPFWGWLFSSKRTAELRLCSGKSFNRRELSLRNAGRAPEDASRIIETRLHVCQMAGRFLWPKVPVSDQTRVASSDDLLLRRSRGLLSIFMDRALRVDLYFAR
jgi:hypothetical protein